MVIEELKKKYDPLAGSGNQAKLTADLNNWKDSQPVMALSAFMKQHNGQGFRLVEDQEDGYPGIQTIPSLSTEDNDERWLLLCQALDLLQAALPDLVYLLDKGLLSLPAYWLSCPGCLRIRAEQVHRSASLR